MSLTFLMYHELKKHLFERATYRLNIFQLTKKGK